MRHHPAIYHIRFPIRALIALLPVIDHPLFPGLSIRFAPIVCRDFHGVLHAVDVRGAVIGEFQLVALAVVIVEGVGVFGFYSRRQSVSLSLTLALLASRVEKGRSEGHNILPRVSPTFCKFTAC